MRVALKLTVVIVALLVTVLAIEGGLRMSREREVVEADLQHEQRLIGLALRPSVENAWETRGFEAATRLLARAQRDESEVQVRLVATRPGAAGAPPTLSHVAADATHGRSSALVERETAPGWVTTYVPVASPDGPGTAIELRESLAAADARLDGSATRVVWTAIALVLGAALLAVILGDRLVGRPVRGLVERAARIAEGDLSPPGRAGRRDELGQLREAIAGMVAGLARERERADAAAEASVEAERRARQSERLVAVGTLAAGVAHELGTPLQVVGGRAKMIERAGDPSVARHATIIREQAKRMERIVQQLLSLARPNIGRREPVQLDRVARETVEMLTPLAEGAGVRVSLEGDEGSDVLGDRDLLGQLLTNLLRNAIQAMPEGGAVVVRVGRAGDGGVRLEVEDDGPGVPDAVRERVFDPFFTTKDVGEGTGLGLAVAHGIAVEHGGTLELTPSAHGARFTLTLAPCEEAA